ncbi:outer membrane protein assembly factor BamB family protein [Nannocystis punicea]|uniref:PQQ-binding-like beta-propeller repeat protein n=1 Tax=Nannocystis punicea TaxID=2995304 RepID=A0ABY7H7Z9_9BACT|nr:PQQ-binding-like beta-propeller repeat protein [Nannocystis poenicansa]WAS95164.1 PQQ-binding-like beta-propeller repeat protein [Nannocystis poenicansa]
MRIAPHTSVLVAALAGCGAEPTPPTGAEPPPLWADEHCTLANPAPYPPAGTYASNHSGRENSNAIPCAGPRAFDLEWHVLATHASAQPNTFAPDGETTYLTTTPGDDGCNAFAVDTATGEVVWKRCDLPFEALASTIDVDEHGDLFLTAGNTVRALDPATGADRWVTALANTSAAGASYGLKFTADGHLVTQVSDGTVYMVERTGGKILAELSVAGETGFVPAEPTMLPIESAPDYVLARLRRLVGDKHYDQAIAGLGGLLGASGGFADNTVCTTARRQVLAVGGGPDKHTGAAVALDIVGTADAPDLKFRWAMPLKAGSASSVVASSDGERAVLGDGDGHIHMIDVPACDDNTDADPEPDRCAPAWVFAHPGGRLLGTVALDGDGTVYAFTSGAERVEEIYALRDRGDTYELEWASDFGPSAQMTTVLTVTDDAIYGVLSQVEPSVTVGVLTLPKSVSNEAVVIDKETGVILHRESTPDSSLTELVLSPRGELFLTALGIYEILTLDPNARDPVGGLRKYVARE